MSFRSFAGVAAACPMATSAWGAARTHPLFSNLLVTNILAGWPNLDNNVGLVSAT